MSQSSISPLNTVTNPFLQVFLTPQLFSCFFFFNDTATTEIYTLSLHDALPISPRPGGERLSLRRGLRPKGSGPRQGDGEDRKSTRLNSSHGYISYAVFCLKKKINRPTICY